jgi:type I restriction enzyme, S subunit
MNLTQLSEICTIEIGKTPSRSNKAYWNGEIPWLSISDLTNGRANSPKEKITDKAVFDSGIKKVHKGTLLYSFKLSIGKVAITENDLYTNEAIAALPIKDSSKVDIRYLYWAMQKIDLTGVGDKAVKGITLNKEKLKRLKIPVPDLETQHHIATLLDTADALRKKDQELLKKYDELARAIFIDMFGDPMRNLMKWKVVKGSMLYDVRGRVGWKGYKKSDLVEKGPLVIGATHINDLGDVNLNKPVFISEEKYIESPEIAIQLNDLLFVQRGNTIGKIALVKRNLGKATINPVLLILRPHNVNPNFLLYLLLNREMLKTIKETNSGSAQPMITQETMNKILLINPPLDLQEKFAKRILIIETLLQKARKNYSLSTQLFETLMSKAFAQKTTHGQLLLPTT